MKRTLLAIDVETKEDADFKRLGTSVYRNTGYLLGVSVADDVGYSEYIDLGHPGLHPTQRARNLARVKTLLATDVPKIGHNLLYDIPWLQDWAKLPVNGTLIDTMTMASLLDEYRDSSSLDSVAGDWIGAHKEKGAIEDFCEREGLKGDPRSWLWKMPHALVEPYAKKDTTLLIPLYTKMLAQIRAENLTQVFDIEKGVFRYILQLKTNGVKIDEKKRREVSELHERDKEKREKAWYAKYPGVNVNSTKQLAELFTRYGIPFAVSNGGKKLLLEKLGEQVDPKRLPMTDVEPLFAALKMNDAEQREFRKKYPSITHDVLEEVAEDFPLAREAEELKRIDKVLGTFINGALLKHQVDGRIHSTFHPVSSDAGGTVSGRMSSSSPNLQQMSTPKGSFDPLVRDCFIPENDDWWIKCDYSQIEYRMLAHFASGPKSEDVREQYRTDPHTDYHALIQSWTGLARPDAKRLNFGVAYFMKPKSMARKFHWPLERVYELVDQYMETVPFLIPTRNAVVDVAKRRGYIKTIGGRHCRISPAMRKAKKEFVAFNRLLQGSSADLMKMAMWKCWDDGVFDVVRPLVNVHDDSSISCPRTLEAIEAAEEMKHIMETVYPSFTVPIIADADVGANWGKVDTCDFAALRKEIK